MRLIAKFSTADGRLTQGRVYIGQYLKLPNPMPSIDPETGRNEGSTSDRIVVFDDKSEWMTFHPKAFVPHSYCSYRKEM